MAKNAKRTARRLIREYLVFRAREARPALAYRTAYEAVRRWEEENPGEAEAWVERLVYASARCPRAILVAALIQLAEDALPAILRLAGPPAASLAEQDPKDLQR